MPDRAATWVAGIDGCKAGWIAVLRNLNDPAGLRLQVFAAFADILAFDPHLAIIAVDMPIGLPDRIGPSGRGPEKAARKHLGMRQSSVFTVPSRPAVYEEDYRAACTTAEKTSEPPKKVSKQCFYLFPKIREIDALTVAAVHLAAGGDIEDLGERGLILTERARLRPIVNPTLIKGHVINIDSYENAITNISRDMFVETVGERDFRIYANPTTTFRDIKRHYNEVPVGEIVALFGSNGLLEIGINQFNHEHNGGASSLLGMNIKDVVRIEIE